MKINANITAIQQVRLNNAPNKQKVSDSNPISEKNSFDFSSVSGLQTSFTGEKKTISDYRKLHNLKNEFSPEAKNTLKKADQAAKISRSKETESWHIYLAMLLEFRDFIDDIDKDKATYNPSGRYRTPVVFHELAGLLYPLYDTKKDREKLKSILNKHIKYIKQEYVQKDQQKNQIKNIKTPSLSKAAIDDIYETFAIESAKDENIGLDDGLFLQVARMSSDKKLANDAEKLVYDVQKTFLVDESFTKQKAHLKFYDEKADTIWKNISLGNNIVISSAQEDRNSVNNLINSFVNLINKPGQKYQNIDSEKTDIFILKDSLDNYKLTNLILQTKKDKDMKGKLCIFVFDFDKFLAVNQNTVSWDFVKEMENKKKTSDDKANIKFILQISPETYFANVNAGGMVSDMLLGCSSLTLPSLSAIDAKKYLSDKNGINFVEYKTGRKFSDETINRAVEISNQFEGNYPDKTINLLNAVSKYFDEKEEITPLDIERYIEDTKNLSEVSGKNEDVSVIFDTGKTLDDIKGSPMTKAQAQKIVSRIKAGALGVKGYCIYFSNGSSYGGGRKNCAQAIAGEAQIPMITINAREFALKDIDAVSQNTNYLEMKMKKIVSNAKAQAEANRNKTAMIFIENFDSFASNPIYGISGIYEQKAFSQLTSEMDSIRKNDDVNLLVIGSLNMPDLIDEANLKPSRFLNSIVVYYPKDSKQIKEVIDYYIDKMGIEVEGDKEEIENITKKLSQTTLGFSVTDIMYLLEGAKNIAKEEGRQKVSSNDFTESFLQVVSGQTNCAEMSESDKKIIASHEAGHAITSQIMREIAQKRNIPWYLPEELDFITLDPRGDFGGANFFKQSENQEINFETVLADIITSYGGHSAEKEIYNIQGSWGISEDMKQISNLAQYAVMNMGMGKNTGVIHIPKNANNEPNVSEYKKMQIEKDIDSITNLGLEISDLIIENYKDFILEFTEKYSSKVASGDCIITAEEFGHELNQWRQKQPQEKQRELEEINNIIIEKIDTAKKDKKEN